jgi:uncharacterized membrane protein
MNKKKMLILCLGLLILLAPVAVLAAQAFTLNWWSVDAGGGSSQGSSYTLSGGSGQPEAGSSQGGSYTLTGGFWTGGSQVLPVQVFLPLVLKH